MCRLSDVRSHLLTEAQALLVSIYYTTKHLAHEQEVIVKAIYSFLYIYCYIYIHCIVLNIYRNRKTTKTTT